MSALELLTRYYEDSVYRYDEKTVLLDEDCLRKPIRNAPAFETFLRDLLKLRHIVLYTADEKIIPLLAALGFSHEGFLDRLYFPFEDKKRLKSAAARLQKLSLETLFSRREKLSVAPRKHPGLQTILQQYLDAHQSRFLDGIGARERILDDVAEYYYFEDPSGKPIAFNKVITSPVYGREAEITYGRGSHQQNLAMMLDSLMQESLLGYEELEINVPYEKVTRLLVKLGFIFERKLQVYFARGSIEL